MSGNVWEWCWDRYNDSTPASGQDPMGAAYGTDRVRRGGGWLWNANATACARRSGHSPNDCNNLPGLRLVCRP